MITDIFDRSLQKEILSIAINSYPYSVDEKEFSIFIKDDDETKLLCNIIYLNEHEFIIGGYIENLTGYELAIETMRITKDGIDFLMNDGGITDIKKTITVKFHDDVINKLITHIKTVSPNEKENNKYIERLKQLPADATKHIVMKLIDQGIQKTPDMFQFLNSLL